MPRPILDARHEEVRHGGPVVSRAAPVAVAIDARGHRSTLGASVSPSGAEPRRRDSLASLQARGPRGVRVIASDAHAGLEEALRARFSGVPWRRCRSRPARDAMADAPEVAMREEVGAGPRAVSGSPDRAEAERGLGLAVKEHRATAPKPAEWMEADAPEGPTAFARPSSHRRRPRATNMPGRIDGEIERRTRVATLLPGGPSAPGPVSAVSMEIGEEWETNREYVAMGPE